MNSRALLFGAAALAALSYGIGSANAYSEVEIVRVHDSCHAGNHDACMRRDMMIHHEHEHEGEWRRMHPEWFR